MPPPPPAPPVGQAPQPACQRVLHSLSLHEDLARTVAECVEEFQELAPRMQLRRAVSAGAWVIGMQCGGLKSEGLPFSRLEFEIHVEAGAGPATDLIRVVRCSTIRNRDAERSEFEATLDDEGMRRLRGFVESAFLAFARRYFDPS